MSFENVTEKEYFPERPKDLCLLECYGKKLFSRQSLCAHKIYKQSIILNDMKRKHLLYLKRSRKAYLVEYGCGLFLLALLAYGLVSGIQFTSISLYLLGGAAVVAFTSAEANRFLTRYKVFEDKIVVVNGIIKQAKKNIYFHPLGFIPDINIKQGRFDRVMNLGTIFVKHGGERALEIKDVNRPHKIMKMIEELVDKNRSTMGGDREDGAAAAALQF